MVTRLFGKITGRSIPQSDTTHIIVHKDTHMAVKIYATIYHMTIQEAAQHLIDEGLKAEELREKK